MQKRWIALASALGGVCVLATAEARQLRTITAATVTSSSTQMLAAPVGPRTFLSINNESATATIACSFGGTAALNTAGSYTIPPGQTRVWAATRDPEYPVPSAAVNCISSAATSPATIESTP